MSTVAAHLIDHPGIVARPTYTLTKLTETLLFQLVAESMPIENVQIVSYNPGLIFNDEWASLGMKPEVFDKRTFPRVIHCN